MKTRIFILASAILFIAKLASAQYTDIIIPESNEAAADINNTTSAVTEQVSNPADLFTNNKNEFNLFTSSASIGASTMISKHISVYNIPISYSFKTGLFFKNNSNAYENLSLKAIIPIAQKKLDGPDVTTGANTELKTTGLGDAILKANYYLAIQKTIFSFGVLAKLPTAKKTNKVKGHNLPIGTGSTDIDLSVFCSKNLENKINVHSSLGYDVRSKYEKDGITYDYGNRFNFLLGGDYFINKFNVGADIAFYSNANDKVNISTYNFKYEAPGLTALDIMPYFKINLPQSITARLYAVVPTMTKWKSVTGSGSLPDPERKFRFGFSLEYRFEKSSESK